MSAYIISGGNIPLGGLFWLHDHYPYYDQSGSLANFNGWNEYIHLDYIAPPVLVGQVLMEWSPNNALDSPFAGMGASEWPPQDPKLFNPQDIAAQGQY